MHLGLGVMVMMVTGCESGPISCHPQPPLMAKADIEGAWSYTTTIVEERDGVWVDVSTSEPLLVQARIDEDFVVFETITELAPWHHDGFELNPERLSLWGHEMVGPLLGPTVRPVSELQGL